MELSPKLYHIFVRPKWFANLLIKNAVSNNFSFESKNVLDFGCGIGSNTPLFPPSNYIGIDNDLKRIKYAKRLYPDYTFHLSYNNQPLPLDDMTIDYVFISSVLHHIPTENLGFYLREFHRVLKPQGSIIIIEPCFFKGSYIVNGFMALMDRGKYIRTEEEYTGIFARYQYETKVLNKFNQLFFYNKLFFVAMPVHTDSPGQKHQNNESIKI